MAGLSASTYNFIASQTLGSTTSSVTFNNIPQTYTDLILEIVPIVNGNTTFGMQFNGDNGGNYSITDLYGTGSTAGSTRTSNDNSGIRITYNATSRTTNNTTITVNIQSYANTTVYKTALSRAGNATDGVDAIAGSWRNYSAITSLLIQGLSSTFASGSTFVLYGIKAADTTAIIPTKAFGGDVIATDGTYTYHAFKNSGSFNVAANVSADILVIAGGGGSTSDNSGGGGAGGVVYLTSQSLTAGTNYTCTVGAGGSNYSNGINSQFGALTAAIGGGRGGGYFYTVGNGGSGGGAGSTSGAGNTAGTGTSGQGNNGGSSSQSSAAGGGGGAGSAGSVPAGYQTGGAGGAGTSSYSDWGKLTGTGDLVGSTVYFAGGGGGAGRNNPGSASYVGAGGAGGGGHGGSYTQYASTNGKPNTGGGGGGSDFNAASVGGSGLIIVRYAS